MTAVGFVATTASSQLASFSLRSDDSGYGATSDVNRLSSRLDERMQSRELKVTRLIATLLESPRTLLTRPGSSLFLGRGRLRT